ncbi:MAG: lipocalin family protein [Bacteroidales bacterium]|nr:lipocalin family protein [Bacteroidales bacterium]
MKKLFLPLLALILFFTVACEKETDYSDMFPGFWVQESILEDNAPIAMSACESGTRLLIERNGVYRLFSPCDTMERSGTWIITNGDMLDLSMDRWNGSNKYEPYPIRFTILKLTDSEMEIRIKTFISERKRMVLFTPLEQDNTAGLTPEEILELDRYNKTLRTYIYRFTKQAGN